MCLANIIKSLKTSFFLVVFWIHSDAILSAQVIVVDAGHGYYADCSNGDGRSSTEINTTHEVSIRLKNLINTQEPSWTVLLTRPSNGCGSWISVTQRGIMANDWNADVFLSIHCNAGGGTGTETFWCDLALTSDIIDSTYARHIQGNMVDIGHWSWRWLREDDDYLGFHLGVLKNLNMTGCLNEIGFVDTPDSIKLLNTAWRDSFALAYFEALHAFLNSNLGPQLLCDQAVVIYPSIVYQGANATDTSLVTYYGCNNWTETGPERVHQVTIDTVQDLMVTVDNFQGDLDVYILSACDESACVGSVNSNSATYLQAPAGTYYIVVDADDGSGSSYDLLVQTQTPSSISNPTKEEAPWIRIFPNPSRNELYVDFTKPGGFSQTPLIQVFDLQGKQINLSCVFQSQMASLDVSSLIPGIYILLVSDSDQSPVYFKFIKSSE